MKTYAFIIALILTGTLQAQPDPEKHLELSLSGLYQNFSGVTNNQVSDAFFISPRLGYRLAEGFEIEPEATLMAAKGSSPVYILNGNVSYNFTSSGKAVPFLLIGYGAANEVPFLQLPSLRTGSWIGVLNVGAGVKGYLSKDVALRLEYRYQQFSGMAQENLADYSSQAKINHEINTLQFGFSVLL